MSGIMSMFSNLMGAPAPAPTPAPTAAQSAPPQPGGIPASAQPTGVSNPNTAPNGMVPPSAPAATTTEPTALDQFTDLWKNPDTSGQAKPAGIFGEVDPKKFMEAAGKIDFTKVVTPEQLQAISTGGEGAVQAFASALNSVAQTTYAQSAFASTKIVEQAMARAKENFLSELPTHIRKQTVSESLKAENPVFSNPAVQPIISALEAQLSVKFPHASAGELTSMAKQYVEALGTSFSPKPTSTNTGKPGAKEETDWSSFLV